ncbi:hypothetical protein P879_01015 [Paragonimus westermani]|uniref:UTP--glucose-1-phosphate uridylyltransferase n=1 Tax=Paragonimus westermani TaxID=34504 RepID=A0A8T0DE12_9TREM|nr:hypothetical protein P879_01015 [Paragonimus westermani]
MEQIVNPKTLKPTPVIQLEEAAGAAIHHFDNSRVKLDKHSSHIKTFKERLRAIPDMLEVNHLTVSGAVHFEKNVELKGTVIIIARENEQIDIPPGVVFENKIITGNLRVLPC